MAPTAKLLLEYVSRAYTSKELKLVFFLPFLNLTKVADKNDF